MNIFPAHVIIFCLSLFWFNGYAQEDNFDFIPSPLSQEKAESLSPEDVKKFGELFLVRATFLGPNTYLAGVSDENLESADAFLSELSEGEKKMILNYYESRVGSDLAHLIDSNYYDRKIEEKSHLRHYIITIVQGFQLLEDHGYDKSQQMKEQMFRDEDLINDMMGFN